MDSITDMLSTFFVSKSVVKEKQRSTKQKKTAIDVVHQGGQLQSAKNEDELPEDIVVKKVKANHQKSVENTEEEKKERTNLGLPRKYILKASEFYKKNIAIVNDDMQDSISMLSDLLHKLSMMNNVNNIYTNKIHIVTTPEFKGKFRNMLIENPYLYFTDFDLQKSSNGVTQFAKKLESFEKERRHILVVDYNALEFESDLLPVIQDNVHIFLLGDVYSNSMRKMYKDMGANTLLIMAKPKLKMTSKQLFTKLVKDTCGSHTTFDTFYVAINDENIDARYIIVKDGELRYN
jgi:hypothetical protein